MGGYPYDSIKDREFFFFFFFNHEDSSYVKVEGKSIQGML